MASSKNSSTKVGVKSIVNSIENFEVTPIRSRDTLPFVIYRKYLRSKFRSCYGYRWIDHSEVLKWLSTQLDRLNPWRVINKRLWSEKILNVSVAQICDIFELVSLNAIEIAPCFIFITPQIIFSHNSSEVPPIELNPFILWYY